MQVLADAVEEGSWGGMRAELVRMGFDSDQEGQFWLSKNAFPRYNVLESAWRRWVNW